MKNIIIYGMRGSGKTTIGKLLAKKNHLKHYDLDLFLQEKEGISTADIVNNHGWERFRDLEHEYLKEILDIEEDKILTLGGGTIIFERNQKEILQNNDKLIYIKTNLKKIAQRIEQDQITATNRPSLTGQGVLEELQNIYLQRKKIYEKYYDFWVNNNNQLNTAVNQIQKKINYGNIVIPIIDFRENILKKIINKIEISKEIKLVELRIDYLEDITRLPDIIKKIPRKVIVTNRIKNEGGKFAGSIDQSIDILVNASKFGANYIDMELVADIKIPILKRQLMKKTQLILSYHNFLLTPNFNQLKEIITEMTKYEPDVYKIVVMPQTPSDLKVIYQLTDIFKKNYSDKKFIFIAMGKLGENSRIRIPKLGGLLTFGTINNIGSAPGQIPFKILHNKLFS